MRKYLLLLFIIIYVNMCQVITVHKEDKPYSSAQKTLKKEKRSPKKVTLKVIKTAPKVTLPEKVKVTKKLPLVVKKERPLTPKVTKKMTKEELFAKMFGKKQSKKVVKNLIVPLIVNQKFGRNTRLNIVTGKHYIQSRDLRVVLMRFLSQRVLDKIFLSENMVDGGIDLKILHQFSIDSYFDEDDLAIYITIPPHIRIPTKLHFSKDELYMDEKFEKILASPTAKVSGASNFYLKNSFRNETNSTNLVRDAAVLRNQTFVNFNDYIFNSGFVVTEQNVDATTSISDPINRDYTYMSRDFPRLNQRFKAGDISLLGLDKMGQQNILGVSLVKHHDITRRTQQSIRVTDKEIYLENESQLEIYVNDRLIRTITLQPGMHLLSDFPLITGLNHVKINIHDIFGAEKKIDFDDFHYQELLKEGVETYGLSMGIVSSKDTLNNIIYDENKQLFSANYNYGLNHDITLNNGLQIHSDLSAYESEFYWGSAYGLFSAYGVLSSAKDYGSGYKYGMLYKNIMGKTNLTLKKEYIDSSYKSVGTDLSTDLGSESFSAQLGTSLIKGSLLSLSYSDREALGVRSERYALSYNQFLSRSWNIKVDLESSKVNSIDDQTARFTLRYTPHHSHINLQQVIEKQKDATGLKEDNQRTELALVKNGRFGLDGTLSHEEIENSSEKDTIRSRYSHQKYLANLNYTQTKPNLGTRSDSGSFGLSTAVAFVGDNYAFTQPVASSFVLVQNDDYFKEKPLGMKSFNSDDPSSHYVIPSSDYVMRELKVEDRDLVFGVDLKKSHFRVASKYKTGSLIQITPQFILSARGVLHDSDGKAVGLSVFKVFKRDSNGTMQALAENAIFFTNKEGRFILNNMSEGAYLVREINREKPRSFTFSTENVQMQEGIIDLGLIKLSKPSQEPLTQSQANDSALVVKEPQGYVKASNIVAETQSMEISHRNCKVSLETNSQSCDEQHRIANLMIDETMIHDATSDDATRAIIGQSRP